MSEAMPDLISDEVADLVARADWITVFSGAGISAESGIATFRDAQTGLWENFDPSQLATPAAFESDPALVWGWYQWRAHLVRQAEPNAGHHALAELAAVPVAQRGDATSSLDVDVPRDSTRGGADRAVMIVTQNVDDLHERAGTPVLAHLHGSLFEPRCSRCAQPYHAADDGTLADLADLATAPDLAAANDLLRIPPPACAACSAPVRPGIVWFGEPLPPRAWLRAESALRAAEVVIVVGTSGMVYPAAELPERAVAAGIPVIEVNPEPSLLTPLVDHHLAARAATALPALVAAIRGR
ncbi:MAG: NAD-dependent deacylase [Gordonia sp. (in: high G+C Gram-positive bacteria)]